MSSLPWRWGAQQGSPSVPGKKDEQERGSWVVLPLAKSDPTEGKTLSAKKHLLHEGSCSHELFMG